MNLPAPLTLFMDILTFALGTYGAIVLVGEFVELDRFPYPRGRCSKSSAIAGKPRWHCWPPT